MLFVAPFAEGFGPSLLLAVSPLPRSGTKFFWVPHVLSFRDLGRENFSEIRNTPWRPFFREKRLISRIFHVMRSSGCVASALEVVPGALSYGRIRGDH